MDKFIGFDIDSKKIEDWWAKAHPTFFSRAGGSPLSEFVGKLLDEILHCNNAGGAFSAPPHPAVVPPSVWSSSVAGWGVSADLPGEDGGDREGPPPHSPPYDADRYWSGTLYHTSTPSAIKPFDHS